MLFVAAAGNALPGYEPTNNDVIPFYPASYDCANIISVLATDQVPAKAPFSNYGPQKVHLGAPGDNIYSCLLGGAYTYGAGTSMAAPHVSGACALLWSMNPSLSYQQVKDIILENAVRLDELSGLCRTGGILNLHNAVTDARVDDNSQAHVWATTLRDSQLVDTAWLDARGNLILDGALHRQSACGLTNFRGFKIHNGAAVIALLDADSGEMFIAGQCNENVSPLNPVNARLVVKASTGNTLAFIDDAGNLHLAGEVFESMWE